MYVGQEKKVCYSQFLLFPQVTLATQFCWKTKQFTLETNDNIRLNIYNINGRKVKTLLSGFTLSGSYSIKWNGQDHSRNDMPSGVYIYQLVSSTQTASNKMILLR